MAWKGSLATTVDALSLVVVIAAAVLVGGHFFREPAGSPEAASEFDDNPVISLVDVPLLGSRSADVILLEFSDYECPYCRRHATGAFKQLKTEFIDTGRIRYGFSNNPLETIHPRARHLATVAGCADRQGRFWEMHEALFAASRVTDEGLMQITADLRLDTPRLLECLSNSRPIDNAISKQVEIAHLLGLESTPGFLVGRIRPDGRVLALKRIRGAQPVAVFRRVLEDIINNGH